MSPLDLRGPGFWSAQRGRVVSGSQSVELCSGRPGKLLHTTQKPSWDWSLQRRPGTERRTARLLACSSSSEHGPRVCHRRDMCLPAGSSGEAHQYFPAVLPQPGGLSELNDQRVVEKKKKREVGARKTLQRREFLRLAGSPNRSPACWESGVGSAGPRGTQRTSASHVSEGDSGGP